MAVPFAYWLLLVLAVPCFGQFLAPQFGFDCRRNQANICGTGTCDLTSGECDCTGGNGTNVNYMCIQLTESGTCNPPCENDGVCVNSQCVCARDYYGNCAMERVQVECEADKMFINVNPHGDFGGLIYVNGYDSVPPCLLQRAIGDPKFGTTPIDNADLIDGWRLTISHNSPDCGPVIAEEKTAEGGVQYTSYIRKFFVQYNKNFKSSVDQMITAECKVANGSATVSSDVTAVTDSDSNYNNVTADDDVDTVTLEVQDTQGNRITQAVILGQGIRLVFTMMPGAFPDFRLTRCKANNVIDSVEDPANFREITFLQNGCPSDEGKSLFTNIPQKPTPEANASVVIIVSIKAFMFIGVSQKVGFVCDVSFCTESNKALCVQPVCPGFTDNSVPASGGNTDSGTGSGDQTGGGLSPGNDTLVNDQANNTVVDVGRRKRAADDEKTVKTQISVYDPLTQVKEIKESLANQSDCIEEPNIMAVVIILAVLVAILLVLLTALTCRYMKTRNKVGANNDWNHHTPGSRPVQTMRIPRLELNTSRNEGC